MQDFAAMTLYQLATHHPEGGTAVYESHFTARAETYPDATAAPALVTLVQTLSRLLHRRPLSHPGATVTPITDHDRRPAAPRARTRPAA